jgi:O-antigen ligase
VKINKKNFDYTNVINYTIIAYAFLLPLSRAGIVFFSALLTLLWILEGNFGKKYLQLSESKLVKVLAIFLLFNLIGVLWSDYMLQSLEYIQKYWYFLPILVIVTSIKAENISRTLSAFILGMFVSEVISYGIFFEWWQYKKTTPQNPSPFMHHIEYSIFLAFTGLVLLGRIFNENRLKLKLVYIFFFITVSGNLFLTAGRTGQIAFILGLFVTAKQSMENVIQSGDYCSSWGSRIAVWVIAEEIMVEHPVLGVGISDNMTEFHTLLSNDYPQMHCIQGHLMHMHNQYIQTFTQLGAIGLFLLLAVFYMIIKLPLNDIEYRNIQYIYVSVVLFAFVSEVLYHRQFSMALFALITGLLLAQHRSENELGSK